MILTGGLAWLLNLPLLALAVGALWYLAARGTAAGRWFGLALVARLAGGVALGVVYVSPWLGQPDGGGDTTTLSEQALALTQWAAEDGAGYARLLLTATNQPGAPPNLFATFSNSFFFVRGLSVLNFLTGGSYWLNGLWLSLAAFAGSWLLARELARVVPALRWGTWLGALAWPSGLFWLSGVSKDALVLAALGGFVAAALRLIYRPAAAPARPWRWLLALGLSGWLFWKIKFFIAAVVFIGFGVLAVAEKLGPWLRRRWPRVQTWQLLVAATVALAPLSRVSHAAFRPEYLLIQIPRNQQLLRSAEPNRPELRLPIEPSLTSFAANAPAAALGVFTRPWLWEGVGVKWRVVGGENAALLLLAAWAVGRWWRRGHPLEVPALAVVVGGMVLTVAVMFGLTTPNLGTLHRYRAILLPFTVFLLAWLARGGRVVSSSPSGSRGQSSRSSDSPADSAGAPA